MDIRELSMTFCLFGIDTVLIGLDFQFTFLEKLLLFRQLTTFFSIKLFIVKRINMVDTSLLCGLHSWMMHIKL